MNWIIGIPLALIFAFVLDFGLFGLNVGFSTSMLGQLIAYLCILLCKSWEDIADEAVERVKKEEQELKVARSCAVDDDHFVAAA